jgi:hypothetical protein
MLRAPQRRTLHCRPGTFALFGECCIRCNSADLLVGRMSMPAVVLEVADRFGQMPAARSAA